MGATGLEPVTPSVVEHQIEKAEKAQDPREFPTVTLTEAVFKDFHTPAQLRYSSENPQIAERPREISRAILSGCWVNSRVTGMRAPSFVEHSLGAISLWRAASPIFFHHDLRIDDALSVPDQL